MVSKLVTIGGSAGAIASILEIVRNLPDNFPAAICVTIHIPPYAPSVLAQLLASAGQLEVFTAEDGMPLKRGCIYVAPPDRHLTVQLGSLHISDGAKENHHRPAIDPLFRSAATSYGTDLTCILLSGYLDDGTAGLIVAKRMGSTVIVQDPSDTIYPDMLRSALEYIQADFVVPLSEMVPTLLFHQRRMEQLSAKAALRSARELDMLDINSGDSIEKMPGKPSIFSCPECKGNLWEIEESSLVRYRCHEGHAYSPLSLDASQSQDLDSALWIALRALDEKAELAKRLVMRAENLGSRAALEKFQRQADDALSGSKLIRQLLTKGVPTPQT